VTLYLYQIDYQLFTCFSERCRFDFKSYERQIT